MNKDRILAVADAIEKHSIRGLGFNMGDFIASWNEDNSGHHCGTTACIAGWAYHLAKRRKTAVNVDRYPGGAGDVARDWMGLSDRIAGGLFYARGRTAALEEIPASHAVAVLRRLAETGKVDWSVGAP
jgi:hypothetical protein